MNLSQKLLLGGAVAAVLGGALALGAVRLAPPPAPAIAGAAATAARAQAERQRDQLAQALQATIDQRLAALRALAAQPGTALGLQALAQAQAELPGPTPPADAVLHDEMLAWLATRLGPEWARAEQTPLPDLGAAVRARSPASAALQQAYVVRNPHGPGQREALDRPEWPGRHAELHAQIHPAWRTARLSLGFDDLLLIDTATDTVVYSVAKDADFATSLVDGIGAASALAETYARVRRASAPTALAVSDAARYLPAPAEWVVFAAVPVFEGDRQVGVLAGRVRLQALTQPLQAWNDQAWLVGPDGTLRSVPAAWAADASAFAEAASAVAQDKRELARHRNTPVGLLPPTQAATALPGVPVRLGPQGPAWQLVWHPDADASLATAPPPAAPAWWPAIAGTGVAMVLAGAGLASLGRRWQAPLAQMRHTLERAARGDTQARSRIDTADEWAELGAMLDRVLDERGRRLQQAAHENERLNRSVVGLLQTVFQLSNKDLTARAEVTEDIIGTLASSINQLGEETSRTLHEVQKIAEEVLSACEFVGEQAVRVDETAQEERAALEGMAASLNQATYQLAQMAALSTNSSEAAELASAATDAALQAVETAVQGMESLRGAIAETEKRFKRLGERSQEISTVVNLINAIAERTHVLSLNASMQASNAGEAGRSFVVVAEEVQRLADSARQATGQIAQLVQSIQVETGDALLTMNRLIAQVVKQSEQTRQAGMQMSETRHTTAQLVDLVQQIAAFSQAQSSLAQELRLSVDQLNRGSAQTILAIEQQTESTATLVDYARRLSEAVGQFRLPPPDEVC
jgi:methyl-accepting chemotaxis protein